MHHFSLKALGFVFTLAIFMGFAQGGEPLKTNVTKTTWEKALKQTAASLMEKASVPGLSIAVVRDGRVVFAEGLGVKNRNSDGAVNRDTIFQAASLSKPVFAYTVLRLVERGVLDLDTPLVKYLQWDGPVRDGIEASHYKTARQDPRFESITARHVLSHTPGFTNWARRAPLIIRADPGTRFSYSGEGFVLLQKAVSDLTGQTLNQVVTRETFAPLGMFRSSFEWRKDFEDNYALGHSAAGGVANNPPREGGNAAGSLFTSVHDYALFITALLKGLGLRPASLKAMMQPAIQVDKNCTVCVFRGLGPQLSDTVAWGLGWGLEKTVHGTAFWHWGDQGVYKNWVEVFQDQKLGVVMLSNSSNGLAIRNDLVSAAIGGEHPAFEWVREDQHDTPSFRFRKMAIGGAMDEGLALYKRLQQEQDKPPFRENFLNELGYFLMGRLNRVDDAITVFQLNVDAYPKSFNVYDSLGEAYMNKGVRDKAISNYKKSIELNPNNDNGKEMLKKLAEEKSN